MSDSLNFRVGPADDAESPCIMKIGIQARKDALRTFKKITEIVQKYEPECTAKNGIGHQWQGMMSLAAYSLAMTHAMLTSTGWEWKEGEASTLEDLSAQAHQLAALFLKENND